MKNQSSLQDQLISIYSRNREDSHATQRKRAWCLGAAARALTEKFGLQKLENLKQNLGAANVVLNQAALGRLDALAAKVKGERYDEAGMKGVNG